MTTKRVEIDLTHLPDDNDPPHSPNALRFLSAPSFKPTPKPRTPSAEMAFVPFAADPSSGLMSLVLEQETLKPRKRRRTDRTGSFDNGRVRVRTRTDVTPPDDSISTSGTTPVTDAFAMRHKARSFTAPPLLPLRDPEATVVSSPGTTQGSALNDSFTTSSTHNVSALVNDAISTAASADGLRPGRLSLSITSTTAKLDDMANGALTNEASPSSAAYASGVTVVPGTVNSTHAAVLNVNTDMPAPALVRYTDSPTSITQAAASAHAKTSLPPTSSTPTTRLATSILPGFSRGTPIVPDERRQRHVSMPVPTRAEPSVTTRQPSAPLPGYSLAGFEPSVETTPSYETLLIGASSSIPTDVETAPSRPRGAVLYTAPKAPSPTFPIKPPSPKPILKCRPTHTYPTPQQHAPPKAHQIPLLNLLAHTATRRVHLPHFDSSGQLLPGWNLPRPASAPFQLQSGESINQQAYLNTLPPPATPGYYNARSLQVAHGLSVGEVVVDRKGKGKMGAPPLPPTGAKVPYAHSHGKWSGKRMGTFALQPSSSGSTERTISSAGSHGKGITYGTPVAGPKDVWFPLPAEAGRPRKKKNVKSAEFVIDEDEEVQDMGALLEQARAKQRGHVGTGSGQPQAGISRAGVARYARQTSKGRRKNVKSAKFIVGDDEDVHAVGLLLQQARVKQCGDVENGGEGVKAGMIQASVAMQGGNMKGKRGGLEWSSEVDLASLIKSMANRPSLAVRMDRKRVSFSLPTPDMSEKEISRDNEDEEPNLSLNWDSDMSDLTEPSDEDLETEDDLDIPTRQPSSASLKIRIPAAQDRPPPALHPCSRCLKSTLATHKQCQSCRLLWRQYRAIRARGERVPAGYFNMTPEEAMAEYEAKKARAKEMKKVRKKERKVRRERDESVPGYQTMEVLVGGLKEGLEGFVEAQALYMRYCMEEGRVLEWETKSQGKLLLEEPATLRLSPRGGDPQMDSGFFDATGLSIHLKPEPRSIHAAFADSGVTPFLGDVPDIRSDQATTEDAIDSIVVSLVDAESVPHPTLVEVTLEPTEQDASPPEQEHQPTENTSYRSARSIPTVIPEDILKVDNSLALNTTIPPHTVPVGDDAASVYHTGVDDQLSSEPYAMVNAPSTSEATTLPHMLASTIVQSSSVVHRSSPLPDSGDLAGPAESSEAELITALPSTITSQATPADAESPTTAISTLPPPKSDTLDDMAKILDVPTAFIFEGSSSIVLGPPPFSEYDIPRFESVLHILQSVLGMTFTETRRTVHKEGLAVRLVCLHEVAVPALILPSVAGGSASTEEGESRKHERWPVLPKRMRGDLEITVGRDRTHKRLPGQKTVVRFQLMG